MTLGRLIWRGVKQVGRRIVAHVEAREARELRREAFNIHGRGQPREIYPSFGQAYETMVFEEERRRRLEAVFARKYEIRCLEVMTDDHLEILYEETCREQGRMYDAMC
jgi:hypothetical protein